MDHQVWEVGHQVAHLIWVEDLQEWGDHLVAWDLDQLGWEEDPQEWVEYPLVWVEDPQVWVDLVPWVVIQSTPRISQ